MLVHNSWGLSPPHSDPGLDWCWIACGLMKAILPQKSYRETKKPRILIGLIFLIAFILFCVFMAFKTTAFEVRGVGIGPELKNQAVPVSEEVYGIIDCESQWDDDVVGDLDYTYHAYGLIQVQERTWNWLSEKMGFEGDINNPADQIIFLTLAIEKGHGRLWSCFKQLEGRNNQ